MAWTERYVRADAAGGGDGTTNTNSGANGAWTLAEGITNEAAGMRLNMLAGTYANTSTTRTFAAVGTVTAPIWWRGFKTSIGDQDSNNAAVAGTDIPGITFTTGQFVVSGAHHIFSNIDVSGACITTNGQVGVTAAGCELYRFRSTNTAANSLARAITFTAGGSSYFCAGCYFKATTTAATLVSVSSLSPGFLGCIFTGGIIGLTVAGTTTVVNCVFDSQAGDAISNSGNVLYCINCSFYAPIGNGITISTVPTGGVLIANCYFENVNQASKAAINNTSGTNTDLIRCVSNAFYNCTANISGMGDAPAIFDSGSLASAAFTNPGAQNFSIGTVAKALGFPGTFENTNVYQGYLDPGAVQRQEPAGGGSTYIFQVES